MDLYLMPVELAGVWLSLLPASFAGLCLSLPPVVIVRECLSLYSAEFVRECLSLYSAVIVRACLSLMFRRLGLFLPFVVLDFRRLHSKANPYFEHLMKNIKLKQKISKDIFYA